MLVRKMLNEEERRNYNVETKRPCANCCDAGEANPCRNLIDKRKEARFSRNISRKYRKLHPEKQKFSFEISAFPSFSQKMKLYNA